MSELFNSKYRNRVFFSLANQGLDKHEIKILTKKLCHAYKEGSISESAFREIVENLLAFFIERSFEEKILSKSENFNHKLDKYILS